MSRQTFTIAGILFAVWVIGISALALAADKRAVHDAAIEYHRAPLYESVYWVNARVSSIYQDRSGKYTIYVRPLVREDLEVYDYEDF